MKRFGLLVVLGLLVCAGEAAPAYFWHLTDTHQLRDYKAGTDPASGCYKNTGTAGRFGDHACDTPPEVMDSSFALMSSAGMPKPSFILWTGDMVPHSSPWTGYLPASVEDYISNITASLRRASAALGGCRVFPILGCAYLTFYLFPPPPFF